jgi:hypothetical protein
MALAHFQRAITDDAGNLQPGTVVTVTNEATGSLAALKSNRAGDSSHSNPITVPSDGILDFYVVGGAYRIAGVNGDFSFDWRYVPIGTAQEADIDDLLVVGTRTPASVPYTFSTTTTDSDPGAGILRFNNATLASATQAYLDNNSAAGQAATAWLDSFDDGGTSSNRGYLHVSDVDAPENFRVYLVTGSVTDGTGYRKLAITHLTGAGSFANAANLNVHFTPKGDTGSATSSADVAWSGDISPSQITADQDDWNPSGLSGAAVIRVSTDATRYINGLQGGADGRIMVIKNVGSNPLVIGAERASSTAANRFQMASDLVIGPGEAATFIYDSTSSRWVKWGAPPKPQHLEVTPDPFPTVPHKPTVYADWSTMPWLDRYFTFTRGSIGTYLDKKGILRTAAAGVPRFHTIYSSGECGLLIEGSRTNLLLRSEAFDNASWSKTAATVTADAAVAPDGATSADKIVESNTNALHAVTQSVTISAGSTVTHTVYAKAAERTAIQISLTDGATNVAFLRFNLSTGAFIQAATVSGGSNFSAALSSAEALPNGWYRIVMTITTAVVTTVVSNLILYNSASTYLGDGTSGLYVWGAQLEVGAFPSSYIPTAGSTVTRSADDCSRSNADGFINNTESSMFAEFVHSYSDGVNAFGALTLSDGTNNERLVIRNSNATQSQGLVIDGGSIVASPGGAAYTLGNAAKYAMAAKLDDIALVAGGGSPSTDSSAAMPTVTTLHVGAGAPSASVPLFGIVKRIAYFPRRISNANLQTITT